MRNPVYLVHLFADIENTRFAEHWDELKLHEVFQHMGAFPMQGGTTS